MTVQVTDLAYLVFGGRDDKTMCKLGDAFSQAFSHENNIKCWKKCGSIPLTRMPLQLGLARYELGADGRIDDPQEKEQIHLKRLEDSNRHYCDFLTANGFDGMALRKTAPVRKRTPAVTAPQSRERVLAIKKRKTAGNHFHTTGGQHLNSDEFFQAQALQEREKEFAALEKTEKQRLAAMALHLKAKEILQQHEGVTSAIAAASLSAPQLKVLVNWKRIKIPRDAAKKVDLIALYVRNPEPPEPVPWTEEDQSKLESLKNPLVPLPETALGVAANQMASAVSNNIANLSEDSRRMLLQSLASFETGQAQASQT